MPLEIQESIDYLKNYSLKHAPYNEHVWGHRVRTDQTPMHILLELFCVLDSQFLAKEIQNNSSYFRVFSKNNNYLTVNYRKSIRLRALLFQNDVLEMLFNSDLSEDEKWSQQIKYLKELDLAEYNFDEHSIAHIRNNYSKFSNFYNAVDTLRAITFEPFSKKRWTSKFLYPLSRNLIWVDLREKDFSFDRRFFARSGELAYLMLCRARADLRVKLEDAFEHWFKDDIHEPFSKIASNLVGDEAALHNPQKAQQRLGYLPYKSFDVFDRYAEDLVRVLSNDEIDTLDKIKVMSDLTGYYLGRYIYSVAYKPTNNNPAFIAEVLTKQSNSIRKASVESISIQRNQLKHHLDQKISELEVYYEDADFKKNEEKEHAVKYFKDHISGFPNMCFNQIGFISRKNTRSYRYVITESFLQTLVITILSDLERMELGEFIKTLEGKYSIFISNSPTTTSNILQSDLNNNHRRFAHLLYQMGMLRHLSDACSYVINPYLESVI